MARVVNERNGFRLIYHEREDKIVDLTLEWKDYDALGHERWINVWSSCLYPRSIPHILNSTKADDKYAVMFMLLLNDSYRQEIIKNKYGPL